MDAEGVLPLITDAVNSFCRKLRGRAVCDPQYLVVMVDSTASEAAAAAAGSSDSFLESLMDTDLYSIGAYFSDEHPDLVDDVVDRAGEIEQRGLEGYARDEDLSVEEAFETLLTGLAVRYYKAVAT